MSNEKQVVSAVLCFNVMMEKPLKQAAALSAQELPGFRAHTTV